MRFKTTPMEHQLRAFNLSKDREYFALLMEQGTGKSKVAIDNIAYLWGQSRIDGVLIIAPNGVHTNWYFDQIPEHMPDWVEYAMAYHSASMTQKEARILRELDTANGKLRIFCVNIEALSTERGAKIAMAFAKTCLALLVVIDESQRMKNPRAIRTKVIHRLKPKSKYRRILTGTPATRGPFDIFSQFTFLDEFILRCSSFFAFKAEYAELEHANSGIMRHIAKRLPPGKMPPQIVVKGSDGLPVYKNLDRLSELIAPHSFRVLKKDCLDLPPKIYKKRYVELPERAKRWYNEVATDGRLTWGKPEDRDIIAHRLTVYTRLQQIVTGHYYTADGEHLRIYDRPQDNPRIVALLETIEDAPDESFIIWAPYHDSIEDISAALREEYGAGSVGEYYGPINRKQRQATKENLQSGKIRFFVGTQASGGLGLTLTTASQVIYYADTFVLEDRIQSEDRPHRIGQVRNVVYTDLEVRNSIDTVIRRTLKNNLDVAAIITGDAALDAIRNLD